MTCVLVLLTLTARKYPFGSLIQPRLLLTPTASYWTSRTLSGYLCKAKRTVTSTQ